MGIGGYWWVLVITGGYWLVLVNGTSGCTVGGTVWVLFGYCLGTGYRYCLGVVLARGVGASTFWSCLGSSCCLCRACLLHPVCETGTTVVFVLFPTVWRSALGGIGTGEIGGNGGFG